MLGVCRSTGATVTLAAPDAQSAEEAAGFTAIWPGILGVLAAAIFLWWSWCRIRSVPVRPWRFGTAAGLATFLLAVLAGGIAVEIAMQVFGIESDAAPLRSILILMLAAWGGQLAAAACLPWIRAVVESSDSESSGLPRRGSICPDRRQGRLHAVMVGFIGLMLFWPMTQAAGWLAGLIREAVTGEAPDVLAHDLLRTLSEAGLNTLSITTMVAVILLPAIVEEVLYRGLLQESIRRARLFRGASPWVSIVATSVVFTAAHIGVLDLHGLVGLFVLSLGLGWAYARTGRLTACITMHMVFNAGNIAVGVLWT